MAVYCMEIAVMKIPRWILLLIATFAVGLSSASAQGPGGESGDKEEDTVYYRRLVKVKNAADEKATVSVQYRTFQADQGKWVWMPLGAPQLGVAETYLIEPGQELDLSSLGVPLSASRIRISAESDNLRWTTHRDLDLWIVPEVEEGEHRYKAGAMEAFTYFLLGLEPPPVLDEKGEPVVPTDVVEQPRNSKFEFGQQKVVVFRPEIVDPGVVQPLPFFLEPQAVLDPFPPIVVPQLEPGFVLVREADLGVVDFRVDPLMGSFSGTVENFGPQTHRGGRRWSVLRSRGPGLPYETALQGWVSPLVTGGRFRVWGELAGLGQGHRFLFALSAGDANVANDAVGLILAPPLRADLAITDLQLIGNDVTVQVTNLGPGDFGGLSRSVTIADQQRVMTTARSQAIGPLAQGQSALLTFRVRPNVAPRNLLMARLNIGDPNLSNDFRDLRIDPLIPIGRLADIRADRIELDGRTLRGIVTCTQDGIPAGFRQILLSYETFGQFPRRSLVSAGLNPLAAGTSQEVSLRLPFDPATTSFRANLSIQPSGVDADPSNDSRTRVFSVGPAPAKIVDLAVGNMSMFGNRVVASVSNVGTDPFPGVGAWTMDAMAGNAVLVQLGKGTINFLNPSQVLPISVPVTVPATATHIRMSVAPTDFNPNNNVSFIPVTASAAQLAIANLRQNGSQLLWSFDKTPPAGNLQGQWSYELAIDNVATAANPQVTPGPVAINLNTNTGLATIKLFNRLGGQRQLIDTKSLALNGKGGGLGGLVVNNLVQNGKTINWNFDLTPPNVKLIGGWTYDVLINNAVVAASKPAAAGLASFDLPVVAPPPTGTLTVNVYNSFGLGNTRTLKDSKSIPLVAGGKPQLGTLTVVNPTIVGNTLTWTFGVNPKGATLAPGWVWGLNQASSISPNTQPLPGVGTAVNSAMIGTLQQQTIDPAKGNQVQVRIMKFGKSPAPDIDQAFPTPALIVGGVKPQVGTLTVVNPTIVGNKLTWTFGVNPKGATLAPGWVWGLNQASPISPNTQPLTGVGTPVNATMIGTLQQQTIDPAKGNQVQVRIMKFGKGPSPEVDQAFPTPALAVVGAPPPATGVVVINDARFEGNTLKWTFSVAPLGAALPDKVTRTFTILQAGNPVAGAGGPIPAIGAAQQFVVDPKKGNGFQIRVTEVLPKGLRNAAFPTPALQLAIAPPPATGVVVINDARFDGNTLKWTFSVAPLGAALPDKVTRTFTILQAGNPVAGAGGPIPAIGTAQQFVVDPKKGNGFQIRVTEVLPKGLRNATFPTPALQLAIVPPVVAKKMSDLYTISVAPSTVKGFLAITVKRIDGAASPAHNVQVVQNNNVLKTTTSNAFVAGRFDVQQMLFPNLRPAGMNNLRFDLLAAPTDGVDATDPKNTKVSFTFP